MTIKSADCKLWPLLLEETYAQQWDINRIDNDDANQFLLGILMQDDKTICL